MRRGRAAGRVALVGLAALRRLDGAARDAGRRLAGPARQTLERALLYLAASRPRPCSSRRAAARAVEPVLAGGALVVIGYGLPGGWCPASST